MRCCLLGLLVAAMGFGQAPAADGWTAADDHRQMMGQLGIRALRPGPSGNESAPNHANYDEAKANPFPDYPDVLRLKNGQRATKPSEWWHGRRAEIVEDFEREVLGRVPADVPKVTWTVGQTERVNVGPYPVVAKELVGRADHSAHPGITVEINMVLVLPAWEKKPVPVMIQFGRAALPSTPIPAQFARFLAMMGTDPPAGVQMLAHGWGYALLDPTSVQADNGAGLRKGIIGLANHGQPRKPEDWGALRAWAWGASRALDYLETEAAVDGKRVGIEGVSRYGKAALVTMAFDPRFAVVLIGSSGEGGVKPHRRNFGEAVENLTGSGEYHWMAGNFLKYGAAEASFGAKTAADIPVDSHELLALCAPRLTFVSYGVPEKGDAKWLDQQGSYMATVAAGEVFRLLGAKDLGVKEDYRTAKMPAVNTGLLDGELAWRQHDGGHTDAPTWKYFLPWASAKLKWQPSALPVLAPDVAVPRMDANSIVAHGQLVEKAKKGGIDVYVVGDSIARRWGATDYPEFLAHWNKTFFGWNAANFGWGADKTQNILWRLRNGELEGVKPKVVVVQGGTNNIGNATAMEIAAGLKAIVAEVGKQAPEATILLMGVFPRNDRPDAMRTIDAINEELQRSVAGGQVRFISLRDQLADANGVLREGVATPDRLHLALPGYEAWAKALRPHLLELLGEPAKEDHAPAATGDPSKKK